MFETVTTMACVLIIGLFLLYNYIIEPLLEAWDKKDFEKFQQWDNTLNATIDSIENKTFYPDPQDFQMEFERFFDLVNHDSISSRGSGTGSSYEGKLARVLHDSLVNNIQCINGNNIVFNSFIALQTYYKYKNNSQYVTQLALAMDNMKRLIEESSKILFCLQFNSYGDCDLVLHDSVDVEKEHDWLLNYHNDITQKLRGDYFELFQCITSIDVTFIDRACEVMWHYARKRPFDVAKFNDSKQLFMAFTRFITKIANDGDGEDIEFGPVESVLAAVFAQNQIGGERAIDRKYLDNWVDWNISRAYSGGPEGQHAVENCFLLCSGLAWMELYNLEKETLRKLFTQELQLPNELQERLTFLESGGNAKIKIYKSAPSADFLYDSFSQNWNDKDLDMFFRQLLLKQEKLGYSLVIEDWKKTIPLVPGTQINQERLSNELAKLVDDFDGEVTSKIVNAKAVNLLNEVYLNATIFTFTSERSRCVSVLFSSEKFGRNLNITIMTLFTPDSSLTNDKLYPYAVAIKGNMYISSFKESILQVVDEVIHIKEKMYDDDSTSTSQQRKVFDIE